MLAPSQEGAYGDVRTTALIVAVMAATLAATGLVQLLMLGTLVGGVAARSSAPYDRISRH